MSIGGSEVDHGIMLRERGSLVLRPNDGGWWRLSAETDADGLLGARVRVEGVRAGFDLLDVKRIERC